MSEPTSPIIPIPVILPLHELLHSRGSHRVTIAIPRPWHELSQSSAQQPLIHVSNLVVQLHIPHHGFIPLGTLPRIPLVEGKTTYPLSHGYSLALELTARRPNALTWGLTMIGGLPDDETKLDIGEATLHFKNAVSKGMGGEMDVEEQGVRSEGGSTKWNMWWTVREPEKRKEARKEASTESGGGNEEREDGEIMEVDEGSAST